MNKPVERRAYYVQAWYGETAESSSPTIYGYYPNEPTAKVQLWKLAKRDNVWLIELYTGIETATPDDEFGMEYPTWNLKDNTDWETVKTWNKQLVSL